MSEQFAPIQELLNRVRARWRRLVLLDVTTRAALACGAVIAAAWLLSHGLAHAPVALAMLALAAVLAVLGAIVWAAWPARHVPSERSVARYIEEREPSLDERLVSAVDVATVRTDDQRPALAAAMVRDAARAAATVDAHAIVPGEQIRRRALRAAGSLAVLLLVLVGARHAARQGFDALALTLFPSRVTLEVLPGNARVQAGRGLVVEAHLVGNTAPVVAQLLHAAPGTDEWQPTEMESDGQGHFRLELPALTTSFRYKVTAGSLVSAPFDVAVVKPPRVARIDVEYSYPSSLGLAPRVEEDGGDIYGPEGTQVVVKVHTDVPVANGRMMLAADKALALQAQSPTLLTAALRIAENGSYRVALADADGMKSEGDTEYFIRILDDRPPDVHIVRPASDRRVTRLEEVEIAAEAQDDFGVAALDLVYAVKGGAEKVVPLGIPPHSTAVTGRYMLYLEDLDVAPGDFVSYYVRARDLPRGKRASESRSDIFFLEVKPFQEEFTLAQTQAAMGGGSGNPQLDDLVAAQKEIVVATWKLDRRSRDAQGAQSESDIRAVAKSEADLKLRVEQTSSAFRETTMRDPRRTRPGARPTAPPDGPQPGAGQPPVPRVGQATAEEDAMTTASKAMGRAVTSLNGLKTSEALPHEMEALNALLKAQADVRKRQIQRQQAGQGAGQNRSTEDLSSLFDKELAKHQQTNYENKTSAEQTEDRNASAVDRIRDLARRQDELVRRQQEFARNQNSMSAEERKRELDSLTREQNDLQNRAEQVAKQLQQQAQQQGGQQGEPGQQGQKSQSGQPSGQPGQTAGSQGQSGQSGQRRPGNSQNARAGSQGADGEQGSEQMRDISEQMRSAANDLKRADTGQASARGAQALDQLRQLEQQLQGSTAEGRRRALGDLQLEARQLADAQRQIASESSRAREGQAASDTLRRLAGEQERLAERLQRVQDGLRQQSQGTPGGQGTPGRANAAPNLQQAAQDAARDIQNQRLAERMQQSAEAMRRSATANGQSGASGRASGPPQGTPTAQPGAANQAGAQQELARALDRLADRLNLVETPQDDESRRLNDQVARARDLRDRMDSLTKQLEEMDRQASGQQRGGAQPGAQQGQPTNDGKPAQGQGGTSGDPASVQEMRQQIAKQLREVRELMNETQRENARAEGGPGSTFEGQGMVLSAPGTQGFKQDFAKWQELTRQVTLALDAVETAASKKLQEKGSKDRLASGGDERAPAEYQQQVDAYFKALAARKRP
ncbi:MAG: hypothetical protein JSU08_05730 [Acidobacteria bacterium]|nr:hypothetical protein [Acidobacteriota bacterium]